MAPNPQQNPQDAQNTLGGPSMAWERLAEELRKLNAHLEAINAPTALGQIAAQRKIFELKTQPITGDPQAASAPPNLWTPEAAQERDRFRQQHQTRLAEQRYRQGLGAWQGGVSASLPPEPPTEETTPIDNSSNPDRATEMARKQADYRRMTGKQRRVKTYRALREGGLIGGLQEYIVGSNYADVAAPAYGHEDDTGEPGTPSGRASVGGGGRRYDPVGDRNIPPGMEGMDLNRIANEGFTMPRFGEFTIQDKMRIARDWAGRRALQAEEGSSRESFYGITAGLLNKGVNNAAQIHAAHAELRRLNALGQGLVTRGEDLGFSPESLNLSASNIGIRAPWAMLPGVGSEAAREGWDQWLDRQRLRMRPGINGEQAREIVNATRQFGYSGGRADDIAFGSLAPLVQEGQQAENIMPLLDAATRLGATSLEDFTETMSGLGEVAQSTRQTLSETQQAMGEFAQTAQQHGATYGQGLTAGRGFMTATGMSASLGGRMMEHDLTQALAFQQYGLLPSQIGLLPGSEMANLTLDTINMGMRIAAPTARERNVQTQWGSYKVSARDAQIAASTQFTGLTADETKRLLRNQDQVRAAAEASTALEGNRQAARDVTKGLRYKDKENNGPFGINPLNVFGEKEVTKYRRDLTGAELAILQSEGNDEIISNREVIQALDKAGVKDDRLKKLRELGGSKSVGKQDEFRREARKALEERTSKLNTEEPDVYIGFTGQAKKWLQQTDSKGNPIKDAANSGGPSLALNAIGAMTPQNAASTMAKAAASLIGG